MKVDAATGCWVWQRVKNNAGYGQLRYIDGPRLAHRVSWIVHRGPIPGGIQVLHKCDVKLCVNPSHLFLGTQKENLRDMVRKDRSSRGGRHFNAVVIERIVRVIRRSKRTLTDLAAHYGITYGEAWNIRSRRRWAHIAD